MDLDQVADELYGLPPEEFTATRNAREKDAKAAGDRSLATEIHALAKPNQVAWLANQLSRHRAEEIRPLLDLGAELRDASESLTPQQLQDFSRQQRRLVGALVLQARQLAHSQGRKVTDDTAQGLQDTLHAALADPDAADRLLGGRLAQGMQHVGFGAGATSPVRHLHAVPEPGGRRAGKTQSTPKKDKRQREVERAEQDITRAEALAREAVEMRDDADAELRKADGEVTDLEARLDKLRAKLERAESEHHRATRDQRRLRTALERADKTVEDAVRRLHRAQSARQRLAGEE